MKKYILIISFLLIILISSIAFKMYQSKNIDKKEKEIHNIPIETLPDNKIQTVKITAAGDCTIGWDTKFAYEGRFDQVFKKNNSNYGYFFANVKDLFEKDDLTIVNLEGTFTNYTVKREKMWNFSAPPDYVNILLQGNIDIVSFANNHTHDYGEQGYIDTIKTLDDASLPYYGYDKFLIKEVNEIKIGFFGLLDIYGQKFEEVNKAIKYLKDNNCDLIIASMHWGIEKDYKQSKEQEKMGHYLIDNGVDLVIGHHPHVIQGIEKYKGKYIIYSLANFSFGGNQNPKDKDTLIYQQTFTFYNNKLEEDDNIKIIPASVSSVKSPNNYQPTILEGEEKDRVLNKILTYSSGFNYKNK